MSYKVRLPLFEGPFDLLVYLIERAKVSIYDIPIAEITAQYMDYLRDMRELNVSLSSEFLVLASELLQIKSQMMLPGQREKEEPLTEDPRSDLAERLAEYRKCKLAGTMLRKRESEMRDIYRKPQEDLHEYTDHPDEVLSLGMDDFVKAFRAFLHRKKTVADTVNRYTLLERERRTVEAKMMHIRDVMLRAKDWEIREISFSDFVENPESRMDTIVSFLSLLQLSRDQYLQPEQRFLYGEITIRSGKKDFAEFDAEEAAGRAAGDLQIV
ncbi:MAG: segregation/condensation protein A [Eubacteriales bacterium]|nr:segregation/condensation protein A [Eubacteriales bacterium]